MFGRNVHKAGFISEIKSILSEFYQYDIGEEELLQMQQAAGGNAALKRKLSDIALPISCPLFTDSLSTHCTVFELI